MKISLNKELIYLILCFVVILYAVSFTNEHTFEPYYSLRGDATGLGIIQCTHDSSLFNTDTFATKEKSVIHKIEAVFWVYYVLLFIFSLPVAVKVVSITMCLLTMVTIYKLGVRLYSKNQSIFFSGIAFFYLLTSNCFYDGISRSFAIFLVCNFLYFFISDKFIILPFLALISTFIYPAILPVLVINCFLILFFYRKKISGYILSLVLAIVILISFLMFINGNSPMNLVFSSPFFKNLPFLADYKSTFYPAVNVNNPMNIFLYFILNLNEHDTLYNYVTIGFLVLCVSIIVLKRREAFRLPKQIWIMLLSSLIAFIIMFPIHPNLGSRQFVFSTPLFLVIFFYTNIFKSRILSSKVFQHVFLTFMAFAFIILYAKYGEMHAFKKYKDAYNYIEILPKDSILAGYPKSKLVEAVPFFAKRVVFFTDLRRDELMMFNKFSDIMKIRKDLIAALYATSLSELENFISQYKIDYFIIESNFYDLSYINLLKNSPSKYDKMTYELIHDKAGKSSFILLKLAQDNSGLKFDIGKDSIYILPVKNIKFLH